MPNEKTIQGEVPIQDNLRADTSSSAVAGVATVSARIKPAYVDSYCCDTSNALLSQVSQPTGVPRGAGRIYLDTETLGLYGLPFLIQWASEGEREVHVVHVFDTAPCAVFELIKALTQPPNTLVGHNLAFDLVALSKLATVAGVVTDWSFDSIWEAERLWRAETPYEERLRHLQLVFPAAVEDTLIAAQSLPPLEDQFMKSPVIRFNHLPVAIVPDLERAFRGALQHRPNISGMPLNLDLAERLRVRIKDVQGRRNGLLVKAAQQKRDMRFLRPVEISFKVDGVYGLKNVARVLGYPEELSEFSLLDDFGRMPKEPCPTIRNQDLYRRLYEYVRAREYGGAILEYAQRDVTLVQFVHAHYRREPGYAALQHNFALVPLVASLRVCGVHVDKEQLASTRTYYEASIAERSAALQLEGLGNYNAPAKVLRFVETLLRDVPEHVRRGIGPITDIRDETLAVAARALEKDLGPSHRVTGLFRALQQARELSKRLSFFDNVVGDSLYPQFRVKGTQTDRMTSRDPQIQNMPAKATAQEREDGIRFRRIFTAPAGYTLLAGDFDQFEMRLVAALAGEPALIEAFRTDVDTHALTALRILGARIRSENVELAKLDDAALLELLMTKDARVKRYRSLAKVLNFATIYGATEYGIARQAGTTPDEARRLLAGFFNVYPRLHDDIRLAHGKVTVFDGGDGRDRYKPVVCAPKEVRVTNAAGVARSFDLPLRLTEILVKLAIDRDPARFLPILANSAVSQAFIRMRDRDKPLLKVLRHQLFTAARALQSHVHRQAFNFRVQSLGAYLTKILQVRLARHFIPPGVHTAVNLLVLPGINVHDELHLYSTVTPRATGVVVHPFLDEVSRWLNVPIKFALTPVQSWADKA